MIRRLALTAASVWLVASPASAETGALRLDTGSHVLALCASEEPIEMIMCYGFLRGVIGRSNLAEYLLPGSRLICVPDSATNDQIRRVVVKFLEEKPESLHYDATQLVVQAMQSSFCPAMTKPTK